MKWMYALAVGAVVGLGLAIVAVMDSSGPTPSGTVPLPSQAAPFTSYVAGTGITETGRGNVAVGTAISGVVAAVSVQAGDDVRKDAPLFTIDDRNLRAQLVVARADSKQAEAELARPRHRLEFLENLQERDRSAVSVEALSDARDDVRTAEATLATARAHVEQIAVEIDRSVVRAPRAGRVLQVNVRRGEFVGNANPFAPPILLGSDSRIYLRVDIDENDAWRVRKSAPAVAVVRGSPGPAIPLRFEYVEPYVVPKTSVTGQSTERPDRRVLQVVYSFEQGSVPVYLGQQLDAYIEAEPDRGLGTTETH